MKLIIADDSMVARAVIKKTVKQIGYDCIEAANGREVLDIMAGAVADVGAILMDWNMPVMDGLETLKQLKHNDRFSAVPVIMVTSESDEKNIEKARKAGAHGHIPKPFTAQELTAYLETALAP